MKQNSLHNMPQHIHTFHFLYLHITSLSHHQVGTTALYRWSRGEGVYLGAAIPLMTHCFGTNAFINSTASTILSLPPSL